MADSIPPILYHYCPMSAFFDITHSRSIWLSSLLQTNDYMEGKYLTRTLRRIAEDDGVTAADTEALIDTLRSIESVDAGLALCLSSDADVLSQWRGYASDATGVSIGFSTAYLQKLGAIKVQGGWDSFAIKQIEYSEATRKARVLKAYISTKELIAKGALKRPFGSPRKGELEVSEEEATLQHKAHQELWTLLAAPLMDQAYSFKSAAFSEEKEWRLLTNTSSVLFDDCDFRMNGARLIPYRDFPLVDIEGAQPLVEVVIGPKNDTPRTVIGAYLRSRGYMNVNLLFSTASYR